MKARLDCSIVIPVRNLNEINSSIDQLTGMNAEEICVVYDIECPIALREIQALALSSSTRWKFIQNKFCGSPGKAIAEGLSQAEHSNIIVTMGDGCDNWDDIPIMINHLNTAGIVSACRLEVPRFYRGGNRIKEFTTRLGAKLLAIKWNWEIIDPTNNFKGYKKKVLNQIGPIESNGFEVGIEIITKAFQNNVHIIEIPSRWVDPSESYHWTRRVYNYLPYLLK